MKILVCIRKGLDGNISPFDACAYEEALKIKNAEVILLTMADASSKDFLLSLTRLGAKRAILLCDKAFAGADTIATAYTLSLAVKKINPDLIFCGRQTLIGDTAQTGPMLSVYANTSLISNVMSIKNIDSSITCETRECGEVTVNLPALLTFERINTLRFPSIFSKTAEVEIWNSSELNADFSRYGFNGSPTRVLKTFENNSGRRKCKFIRKNELNNIIDASMIKDNKNNLKCSSSKISKVVTVTEKPYEFAKSISDDITVIENTDPIKIADFIKNYKPNAVLWASDDKSKENAAKVAAALNLGLCADCTFLKTDKNDIYMYRPALSGSIIAKIKSLTVPAMATVRTDDNNSKKIIVGIGYGAKDNIEQIKKFADSIGADIAASRKIVDNDFLPYKNQVGLTGKTVSPVIYIAIGISGAVHHIAGIEHSGTVIAINSDKSAPIFDYADYGIIDDINTIF